MNKLIFIVWIVCLFGACSPSADMTNAELKSFIADEDNGYIKTINIGSWRYTLLFAPTEYFTNEILGTLDQGIGCILEIGNTASGANRLPSEIAAQQAADHGALSNYYTYQAQHDAFLEINGTERVLPHSYLFEPGLGIQDNDRLLYSFTISNELFQKIENARTIRFVFTDHILGHGIINFSLDQKKIMFFKKLNINHN